MKNLANMLNSTKEFVKNNKGFCLGAVTLVAAGVADWYMTSNSISGRVAEESNPLARYLFQTYGSAGLAALKVTITPFLIYGARKIESTPALYYISAFWTIGALGWLVTAPK